MVDNTDSPSTESVAPGRGVSRRRVLSAAFVGVMGGVTGLVEAHPAHRIELAGCVSGWKGVWPAGIKEQTNPHLTLVPGTNYTVTWTNSDGAPHNFVIEDADGNDIVRSEIISRQGQTQTVEFTATEAMAEYYCEVHPQSMRGYVRTATNEPQRFSAELSGQHEVPPVDTDASGSVDLMIEQQESRLCYELTVSGPWNGPVTQAHIHLGGPNENGPVVAFLLDARENPVACPRGTVAKGTITAEELRGPLSGADLTALVDEMTGGTTYVNVHTTAHPAGEIRGQIEEK